jgi:hypothetical protein
MTMSDLKAKTDAIKRDSFTAVDNTPDHDVFLTNYIGSAMAGISR